MAQLTATDLGRALVAALEGPGIAAQPVAAPVPPITIGFTFSMPTPGFVEMNIVRPYRQARLVHDQTQEAVGWELCRAANALKRQICVDPSGVQSKVLREYAALLAMVREHVQTNDLPYVYNPGVPDALRATDIDFELYMTLATLSARYTLEAREIRQRETAAACQEAGELYAQAADVMEAAYATLCNASPPRDRLGISPQERWLPLVTSRGFTPAESVAVISARTRILRCENAACHYEAAQRVAQDEGDALKPLLLRAGEYVAREFSKVAQSLASAGQRPSTTRLARYAEFMAGLHRTRLVAVQAKDDVDTAERDTDAIALGRAFRRLDQIAGIKCGPEAHKAVDQAFQNQLATLNKTLGELRGRCDTLASSPSGVFSALERSGPLVEPLALDPINPESLLYADDDSGTPPMGGAHVPFSIAALRDLYMQRNPRFVHFLALRTAHDQLLEAAHAQRAEPAAHGRSMGDVTMQAFSMQLAQSRLDERARRTLAAPGVLSELIVAAFYFGRVTERKLWTDFSYLSEDADASVQGTVETAAARDAGEVDEALAQGVAYFADLAKELRLSFTQS
jgi:hypothetical protein